MGSLHGEGYSVRPGLYSYLRITALSVTPVIEMQWCPSVGAAPSVSTILYKRMVSLRGSSRLFGT